MNDDVNRWQQKYLQGLQRLDEQEGLWRTRLDLLRRSLVRTSMAAEGMDPAVDACLGELRDLLRREELDAGLGGLVPRLEKAVLEADRRRERRTEEIGASLRRLVEQLRRLPLDGDTRKALKRLGRQIDERVGQLADLQPLLHELAEFQARALEQVGEESDERPGFIQRLFPPKGAVASGAAASGVATSGAAASGVALAGVTAADSATPALDLDDEALDEAATQLCAEPPPASAAPVPVPPPEAPFLAREEVGYSQVAERIQATLMGLLDDLCVNEDLMARSQQLRARIQAGLNWYELCPALEDLAALLRGMSSAGRREFHSYLQQLNQRLSLVQESLIEMGEGHSEQHRSAQSLDDALRQQVGGLHEVVQQGTDLALLKSLVEARLGNLLETVEAYQQQRQEAEARQEARLQQLNERLASMEQATSSLREHLDEQRRQSLLDSLTGLANRAAWNERIALEVARVQRYGGELQLAVLDLDHFKQINDRFGHAAGDRVLKIVAGKWRQRLRKTDFIARFGGEEFVLLLPSTGADEARHILDALRTVSEECPFHFKGERIQVTVSAGLTTLRAEDTAEQAFERADQALYRAKAQGRNRVEQD